MKGDIVIVDEHHRRAAASIAAAILPMLPSRTRRFVVTVAGESGSGKSETAAALAECLVEVGIQTVVLGQDDYFRLTPKANDARRRRDLEWLGPHAEVLFDLLQANVDAALAGASAIDKPSVDYATDSVSTECLALAGVKVVIVEGTYVSLLRHVDIRVFIARDRLATLEHRRRRNRGEEVGDPFVEGVLRIEHKIIAGHRYLADIVVTTNYDVVRAK